LDFPDAFLWITGMLEKGFFCKKMEKKASFFDLKKTAQGKFRAVFT
jgi:hypothetical protein